MKIRRDKLDEDGNVMELTKEEEERRLRYDQHNFAIEDPFDLSHDLGRVVNETTIRIIRDEFIRAVAIIIEDGDFHRVCEKVNDEESDQEQEILGGVEIETSPR